MQLNIQNMISVKGYKEISYHDFQTLLHNKKNSSDKSFPEIAVCCQVKNTHTINNAFNTNNQVAKDGLLTKLMVCLGIDGFILWKDGNRLYFVKNGK